MKRNLLATISKMLTGLLLMGGMILSVGVNAKAANRIDINNNSMNKAVNVSLNETYIGNCSSCSTEDYDWYRFKIPQNKKGYFNIVLGPEKTNSVSSVAGWRYKIYKEGEADPFLDCHTALIKTTTTSVNLPYESGTYYVVIYGDCANENYSFSVKYTEDTTWETEKNDDSLHPNTISVNTTYHGNLISKIDEDWYTFTIPHNGKVVIAMGANASEDITMLGSGWNLLLYKDGEPDEFSKMEGIRAKTSSINYYLAAGTYKIRIYSYYNSTAPVQKTYDLNVAYNPNVNCEAEPNNTTETATPVKENVTYTGNIMSFRTGDYYVFTSSATGKLNVTFNRDAVGDPKYGFDIVVLDTLGNKLGEKSAVKEQSVSMDPMDVTKGTVYYLYVGSSPYSLSSLTGVDYHFSLNVVPATVQQPQSTTTAITKSKVTVSSAKSKAKKKVYLKWKKNKYADGYKVYRSTKKKTGYKCIATLNKRSKVSYTDKKVKSKKVYYYKVRAYRKNGKKTIYSGYSPVKRVKVK